MSKDDALWVYVAILLLQINGVVVDAFLYYLGQTTITQFCGRNPWMTVVIIGLIAIGMFGLGIHLTNGRNH